MLIDRSVVTTVRSAAENAGFRHEVGGVLLGLQRQPHLHVCEASTPKRADRASPTRFWRSPVGHQAFADAAWRRSGGHVTYLGEWHSHSQDNPLPSAIDRGSWAKTRHLHRRPLVFLIVGRAELWLSVEPAAGAAEAWTLVDQDEAGCLFAPRGMKAARIGT